ncbi:Uu.00g062960.m01.CDS01 [Anthostomella pinea]|uniref:Uu.00g062960.m01.CDS01 n=1 Tax=Anthostomella pinea TaxID=933095 RepID=A0AAI8YN29_9PEZI|nr:Uu.00g062960.m01.CDS01 [Anthostomella pinea]
MLSLKFIVVSAMAIGAAFAAVAIPPREAQKASATTHEARGLLDHFRHDSASDPEPEEYGYNELDDF